MLNVSSLFRNALSQDKRFFLEKFNITLKDGTVLNLTNENVWSGSLSFEDAVSSDSDLQLGAAIINKEAITLNNIYGDYSNYDFLDAVVVTQVGLEIDDEGTVEYIKKGTFTVDSANFDNSLVSLTLLDFMAKFEKPFSEVNVTFPITADALVRALCTHCNVILGTLDFPHKTFSFATGPQKESCSCREVLSWVAQAVGCFARCNVEGKLELKWFDRAALEQELSGLDGGIFDNESPTQYVTGDSANGGTFSPWSLGTVYDGGTFVGMRTNVHYIPSTFNHTISVDEVIITGVRILVKTENSSSAIATYMTGTDGYVIEISNNELITASNANTILAWLGPQLIGLTYRKANVSAPSDPSIESGDVALVWDRKGNRFPILVTKVTFSPGSQQTIVSAAQNPVRNNSARYSVETKNYVATHRAINAEKTARELVEESLRRSIENANGLYQTDVTSSSGTIHYLHSKPLLADSDIRIMISDVGVLMTADGTAQTPTWYGLTVDGTLISNIMNTIGINFDWGTGGTLTLGGYNNVNGLLRVLDASGNQCGQWSNDGINISKGSMNINNGRFNVSNYGDVTGKSLEISDHIILQGKLTDDTSKLVLPFGYRTFSTDPLPGSTTIDKNGILVRNDYNKANNYYDMFEVSTSRSKQFGVRLWNVTTATDSEALTIYPAMLQMEKGYNFQNPPYYDVEMFPWSFNMSGLEDDALYSVSFSVSDGRHSVRGESFNVIGYTQLNGNLYVTGTKSREVETEDYGNRLLYCYETPTPMFGDVGEGVIGEDGRCFIPIDPTFVETISNTQYQVFLQVYGDGRCHVSERKPSYFIVEGTPDLSFGWELKAKQRDYEQRRLDTPMKDRFSGIHIGIGDNGTSHATSSMVDYGEKAIGHIEEINRERMTTE